MSARRDQLHTALAVLFSMVLHASIIGVAGVTSSTWLTPDSESALQAASARTPLPLPPPPPPDNSIPVGNPDSTTTALTWIGYNEFEEHVDTIAGPIDQPALTFDPPAPPTQAQQTPISSPQSPPPSLAQAAPAVPPSEPAPPTQQSPRDQPDPLADKPDSTDKKQTSPRADLVTQQPPQQQTPAPESDKPPTDIATGESQTPPVETTPSPESDPAELDGPPSEPTTPPSAHPDPSPPAPPPQLAPPQQAASAPSAPAPPPSPSASDDAAGEQTDRESDAAATKTAARAHLGKPLATKGLKIRTVKPRSSHYNAILARYVDPIIRVHFDRRGVVQKVEFIRKSENRDVDLYVMNAAYQWTAEGPPLEALPNEDPPATLAVDFVIVRPLSG